MPGTRDAPVNGSGPLTVHTASHLEMIRSRYANIAKCDAVAFLPKLGVFPNATKMPKCVLGPLKRLGDIYYIIYEKRGMKSSWFCLNTSPKGCLNTVLNRRL